MARQRYERFSRPECRAFTVALVTSVALLGTFAARPAKAAEVELRAAHTAAVTEPYQIGLEKFRSEVQKATDGAIKVEIFPNGVLGDEDSVLKSMQSGAIAVAPIPAAIVANLLPRMDVFNLPFLFKDSQQALRALDGKAGEEMAKPLAKKGLILLGYYTAGIRNVLNNSHPIDTLADLKGMKIRIVPSKMNIATFRALGANPVPLPYSELYTSLQTHLVVAADAANSNYYAKKFYEVAPYYAIVRWQVFVSPLLMSKKIFDRLSPSDQAVIRKAAMDSVNTEWNAYREADATALKELIAHGVKVTYPARQPWINAVQPVWEKWAPIVGQKNIDAIEATK